jgi:hypothetical protein
LTASLHALVDRFDERRLANNKVKRLETENAELRAELEAARSKTKEAGDRAAFQVRVAAAREKSAREEADTRAAADAEKIGKLEADLSAARGRAVEDFLSSQDFQDRQLDFASDWVLDTVGQCQRLCKEKFGAGDFLKPSEVARLVEARRREGAEIVLESGSSSDEEDGAAEVEPTPDVPSSDPPISPAL